MAAVAAAVLSIAMRDTLNEYLGKALGSAVALLVWFGTFHVTRQLLGSLRDGE
jgi:hypothetical protein